MKCNKLKIGDTVIVLRHPDSIYNGVKGKVEHIKPDTNQRVEIPHCPLILLDTLDEYVEESWCEPYTFRTIVKEAILMNALLKKGITSILSDIEGKILKVGSNITDMMIGLLMKLSLFILGKISRNTNKLQ